MTDYTAVYERARRQAIRWLTYPNLSTESQKEVAVKVLRQHPSPVIQLYPVKGDA
jgi:hypothetical protein